MILVEHGPEARPALFHAPQERVTAWSRAEVLPALERLEAARAAGAWVAGYLSYEAGYAFEEKLHGLIPEKGGTPLLHFGIYDGPQEPTPVLARMAEEAAEVRITAPVPRISRANFDRAIRRVLDWIAAGDCYQVNLTFPLQATLLQGTPRGLYGMLRRGAPVGHGAYVDLGEGPVIVSQSPELFIRLSAAGRIEARPMKGTRPRAAAEAEDRALAEALRQSVKDRAENLMIVDLLRNDISRLAKLGTVRVPDLFTVETYETVHQMTSGVVAELAAPARLPELMAALFPCGSITGAPKIRAMEIIRAVEPYPRGAYCGAIGWMAPDGSADFSVAIRTLSLFGEEIVMNVGGGIVHDSTPEGEWQEALWKARFVTAAERPISN